MIKPELTNDMIFSCLNTNKRRYSVWVYDKDDVIQVYQEEKPNTVEVWFEFNEFSQFYWILFERECVESFDGGYYYNYKKSIEFMIARMLCATSLPWVGLECGQDGSLTKESYEEVMRVHPRILTGIMTQVEIFMKPMKKSEQKKFDKQCAKMFGQNKPVVNPNQWLITYNVLKGFWDKLGINFIDLMRMPRETYYYLRKVMNEENNYQAQALNNPRQSSHASHPNHNGLRRLPRRR